MRVVYELILFIETTGICVCVCVCNAIHQFKHITAFGYVDHSNPMDERGRW